MPLITDWLTVIITAVYVVATIFICIYNGKSAKAAREQLAESQRQFEENLKNSNEKERRKVQPYLMLTAVNVDGIYNRFLLSFVNYGDGSAKEIKYITNEDEQFLVLYQKDKFYKAVISSPISKSYLRKEQTMEFGVAILEENKNGNLLFEVKFKISFKDLLDNEYEQEFFFNYGLGSLGRIESYSPVYLNQKEQQ